jgi:hypothetical protein
VGGKNGEDLDTIEGMTPPGASWRPRIARKTRSAPGVSAPDAQRSASTCTTSTDFEEKATRAALIRPG